MPLCTGKDSVPYRHTMSSPESRKKAGFVCEWANNEGMAMPLIKSPEPFFPSLGGTV